MSPRRPEDEGPRTIRAEIVEAVLEYVNAWTWEEKRAVVEKCSLLLFGDDADLVIEHLISQNGGQSDVVSSLSEHRAVLARCREVGIGLAFDPHLRPQLDSVDAELLTQLQSAATERECLELLARYPTLRRVLLLAVQALFNTHDLRGKRAILERERALLLTAAAEYTVGILAERKEGEEAEGWARHKELLSAVREHGIDAVFASLGADTSTQADRANDVHEDATGSAGMTLAVRKIIEELAFAEQYTDAARVAELCRQGLGLVDAGSNPALTAFFHQTLASGLLNDRGSDRSTSIEAAIEHFTSALVLARKLGRPHSQAGIIQGLASAFADRRVGSFGENQKHAAQLCEEGLELLAADDTLEARSLRAHLHVAAAQAHPAGVRARSHAEEALALIDRDRAPRDWAATHLILGRLTDLDTAIGHFEAAETVFSAENSPEDFAILQGDFAAALRRREGSRRAQALEDAIQRLEAGLGALSHVRQAQLYASLSMDLGSVYLERLYGDPADNVEKAIAALQTALRIASEHFPDEWADAQVRLGKAYRRRIIGQFAANLAAARAAYEAALTTFTREEWPRKWAETHVELGLVDLLGSAAGAGSIDGAIRAFELTLECLTRDNAPETWAFELGVLHAEIANSTDVEYRNALACFHSALEVPSFDEDDRIDLLREVADLQLRAAQWDEALTACREAIDFASRRRSGAYTAAARRRVVSRVAHLHDIAAYSLVRLNRAGEALVCLDGGRSQLLLAELTFGLDLERLSSIERDELGRARDRLASLETEQALPPDFQQRRSDAELGRLLAAARAHLTAIIERFRPERGAGPPPDESVVLRNIPAGEALVEMAVTPAGGVVFVIPGGTRQLGPEHVLTFPAEFAPQIRDVTERFLSVYIDLQLRKIGPEGWNSMLAEAARWLWDAMIGAVHARLLELGVARDSVVTFAPAGGLAMLPLHASRPAGGTTRTFLDDFVVAYAPASKVLRVCRSRAAEPARTGRRVTIVSNPTLDLADASAEAGATAALAGGDVVTLLEGMAADRDAVRTAIPGAAYVHFACHGYNNWHESDFSGVFLAGRRPFTAAEITSTLELDSARLVTLSACETGVRDLRYDNELLGLPAAFLRAGAPGVIATLWSVSEQGDPFFDGTLLSRLALRAADAGPRPASRPALAAPSNRGRARLAYSHAGCPALRRHTLLGSVHARRCLTQASNAARAGQRPARRAGGEQTFRLTARVKQHLGQGPMGLTTRTSNSEPEFENAFISGSINRKPVA